MNLLMQLALKLIQPVQQFPFSYIAGNNGVQSIIAPEEEGLCILLLNVSVQWVR